jgi:hypothetical protein
MRILYGTKQSTCFLGSRETHINNIYRRPSMNCVHHEMAIIAFGLTKMEQAFPESVVLDDFVNVYADQSGKLSCEKRYLRLFSA